MPPLALAVSVTLSPTLTLVELTVELFVSGLLELTLTVNFLDLIVPVLSLTLICTS